MRNPDCPKCGKIMDTFADDFWCPRCRTKYSRDGRDLIRERLIEEAGKLERVGRYEAAAIKYEKLEMWDKAGECRRREKNNFDNTPIAKEIIKEKQVIVKIRCPYCKNLYEETYDKCPYCGAHT
jgi:tRNA(Ile2) C34 agmatinyltransferase TiaS